jgi:hypothetical protein
VAPRLRRESGPFVVVDICLACQAGFPSDCLTPDSQGNPCNLAVEKVSATGERGPYKEDEEVTDPHSTGRKRAAVAYPISKDMVCEWAGLKFAGGGLNPIVGCGGNKATNRHHGPDKDTLNNSEGNVHRICPKCHNRWHAQNDAAYEEKFGTADWKDHDPSTEASPEDILKNEVYWSTR